MNLVAKEYVAAQNPEDPGVLILSRFAGSASECKQALLVNPYDSESVARAIAAALEMSLAERRDRHREMFETLLQNPINAWSTRFVQSLQPSTGLGTLSAGPAAAVRTSAKHERNWLS